MKILYSWCIGLFCGWMLALAGFWSLYVFQSQSQTAASVHNYEATIPLPSQEENIAILDRWLRKNDKETRSNMECGLNISDTKSCDLASDDGNGCDQRIGILNEDLSKYNWHNSGLSILSVNMKDRFRRLNESGFDALVPSWIITPSNESHIHRFFDSSALSPSNRYLAVLEIPGHEDVLPDGETAFANVVIVDLLVGGNKRVVYRTLAWDTQVGAHLQWLGSDDETILFNSISQRASDGQTGPYVHGVMLNIVSHVIKNLSCPIYHVREDGKYAVSTDLSKIRFTQRGYGVYLKNSRPNLSIDDLKRDGIYITDLQTGSCSLYVTLYELYSVAKRAARDGHSPSFSASTMFGFHVKWSTDGSQIMIITRSLEYKPSYFISLMDDFASRFEAKTRLSGHSILHVIRDTFMRSYPIINQVLWLLASAFRRFSSRVRRQHLFAVTFDESLYRRLNKWPDGGHLSTIGPYSSPTITYIHSWSSKKFYDVVNHKIIKEFDANHPAWIPGTNKISINIHNDYYRSIDGSTRTSTCKWSLSAIDLDALHIDRAKGSNKLKKLIDCSSGHPAFFSQDRYVIIDAYAKEISMFTNSKEDSIDETREDFVPLRLIDLQTKDTLTLLKMKVLRDKPSKHDHRLSGDVWRCDLHPSISRDRNYVVYNGRVDGFDRQVIISYIGHLRPIPS